MRLHAAPGARYRYSNFGFVLLAHALSRAAGADFEELLIQRVLAPLDMHATGTIRSMKHVRPVQGCVGTSGVPIDPSPRLPGPGGMWTTAADMLRWLRAHLRPEQTPVAEAIALTTHPQRRHRRVISTTPGSTMTIGLAWAISPSGVVWHNGATRGFSSYCGFSPLRRRSVVALSNNGLGAVGWREALPSAVLFLRMSRGAARLLS